MAYARQLQCAEDEVVSRIGKSESDLEKLAWLGAKSFEHSMAVLIECRSKRVEQFVANVCYLKACRLAAKSYIDSRECWAVWPKSHTVVGQYHLTGSCALDLAYKFAEGIFAEVETARLNAYPRQSIDGHELRDLTEWPTVLWRQLGLERPELADWPLWSIHQERGRILSEIGDELRVARTELDDNKPLSVPFDETGVPVNRDHLSGKSLVGVTQQLLTHFFRCWENRPEIHSLRESNGKYLIEKSLPEFESEYDGLMQCLHRVRLLAESHDVATLDLSRCQEAMYRYDVPAAASFQYGVLAEMRRLQSCIAAEEPCDSEEWTDDGLDEVAKVFVWGGKRYEALTPGMMRVLKFLISEKLKGASSVHKDHISRRADVSVDNGFKSQVFKVNRKGERGQHAVSEIVIDKGGGFYSLIDR